eukprot:CAMPEP_0179849238 /NCGR_PEP_ID=MMETSP0982-20121206/7051_1 /TAXON_ID=483367 /ORGANISM="non described non described, Strain CCMP 2436" /LENGTH=138 /DNA_ID=CAMNT_0021734559 /DNA_START=269 /DNA_END=685 /DNA_ORIENTATION=-
MHYCTLAAPAASRVGDTDGTPRALINVDALCRRADPFSSALAARGDRGVLPAHRQRPLRLANAKCWVAEDEPHAEGHRDLGVGREREGADEAAVLVLALEEWREVPRVELDVAADALHLRGVELEAVRALEAEELALA